MSTWIKAASESEFTDSVKLFVHNGKRIALFKSDDGIYAINDKCSHAEGSLSNGVVLENEVQCPEHGARFDIKSGKNLSFPAVSPVVSYPVKIENGNIYLLIEK
jgi:3-phenylpropionate/trans-cinnamate dioxygenase ferredoxin component